MMPLWTTTRLPEPSVWGCAFSSVGRPWWPSAYGPTPIEPVTGRFAHERLEPLDAPAARA